MALVGEVIHPEWHTHLPEDSPWAGYWHAEIES